MSTVVRTERTQRIIQWSVELPTVIAEVQKAVTAAYEAAAGMGIDTSYDDCIEALGDDGCLILRLTVPMFDSTKEPS